MVLWLLNIQTDALKLFDKCLNFLSLPGSPGIGKSTNGKKFISTNIGILNHDALFIDYRPRGKAYYEDLSNLKANDFIQQKLSNNDDFGLEISFGFNNHQSGCKKIFQK